MNIWNWIKGEVNSIDELKPVIVNGETILADFTKIIKDLKTGNVQGSIVDVKQISTDIAAFATQVEVVINSLQTNGQNNTPTQTNAHM